MTEHSNSSNQQIDTNQPKPLRGLTLRGVKILPTIQCEGLDGEPITVNEEDYDKELHGKKCAANKLPKRGKKKASKKKASTKKKVDKADDKADDK